MEYQIHLPEYLAKCINKARPQLHCNGQCVLMEKMKQQEKEESRRNLLIYEYSSLYVHNDHITFKMAPSWKTPLEEPLIPNLTDYCFQYHNSIFRPPIV